MIDGQGLGHAITQSKGHTPLFDIQIPVSEQFEFWG